MQAIAVAFSSSVDIKLPGWIGIAGAAVGVFAFVVPTLHALRFYSTCSLFLSCIYTFIAISIAFSDGKTTTHVTLAISCSS